MLDGKLSGCINHPGVEATVRCKQCAKPVCGSCVVTGPTGRFCSIECRDRHEAFVKRARELKDAPRRSHWLRNLRRFAVRAVLSAAGLAAAGYGAVRLNIPVAADAVRWLLQTGARYMPW